MRRYSSREEFRKDIKGRFEKKGFHGNDMDEYNIQVLQDYRIAAAFAVAILSVVVDTIECLGRDEPRKVISRVILECQNVLADDSVYILNDHDSFENSKLLKDAVKKAREAIVHAGNVCNNYAIFFPDKLQKILLQARDICDFATKIMRIGDC